MASENENSQSVDRYAFSASAYRNQYLRRIGQPDPDPEWWQVASAFRAESRFDYLATIEARQLIHIPAELLGGRGDDFRTMVHFSGSPISRSIGNADTVMERMDGFALERPIRTRLVAFSNVSSAPLELPDSSGGQPAIHPIRHAVAEG
jgi:hypothetical protein